MDSGLRPQKSQSQGNTHSLLLTLILRKLREESEGVEERKENLENSLKSAPGTQMCDERFI